MFNHDNIKPYVYCILKEAGFHTVDLSAAESLTEMFQSCKYRPRFSIIPFHFWFTTISSKILEISVILEIGKNTRAFCEAAGRVEPLPCDVILALIDLGLQINGMEEYTFRSHRQILPAPVQSAPSKQLSLLAAGLKQQHPHYIPNHLPQFPDPHAYTRSPVSSVPEFLLRIIGLSWTTNRWFLTDPQKTGHGIRSHSWKGSQSETWSGKGVE